jgi:large subunit ribosomal protein L14e
MEYKRFIEIGRIVIVNYGPAKGKIGAIVDIIDKNRCLIDGWSSRQVVNCKRITLTKQILKINRGAGSKQIKMYLSNFQLLNKWYNSQQAQNIYLKKKKSILNDYDKFKYTIGKKYKNAIKSVYII